MANANVNERVDVYDIVNSKIMERMKAGEIPWIRPWKLTHKGQSHFSLYDCRKYRDGKLYSLLNQMLLGEDGIYLSFKEVQDAGGRVKKGAKSKIVTFWKWLVYPETDEHGNIVKDENGKQQMKQIPMLRYYKVFDIKDTEGVKEKKWMAPEEDETVDPSIYDPSEAVM